MAETGLKGHAEVPPPEPAVERAQGMLRRNDQSAGEFAILISDQYQHRGLGNELLRRLVEIGRQEKLDRIVGDILPDKRDMLRVCEKLGFRRNYSIEAGIVKAAN